MTSLIEVATVLLWLQMNRHFLWMIPLSHLVIFSALAIPTAIGPSFMFP